MPLKGRRASPKGEVRGPYSRIDWVVQSIRLGGTVKSRIPYRRFAAEDGLKFYKNLWEGDAVPSESYEQGAGLQPHSVPESYEQHIAAIKKIWRAANGVPADRVAFVQEYLKRL